MRCNDLPSKNNQNNNNSKTKKEKKYEFSNFVIGLLLTFMSLIAFFNWGFLGILYSNVFRFFVGENYPLILLALLYFGILMMARGRLIPFKWTVALGGFLVLSALTTVHHFNQFYHQEPLLDNIFSMTYDIFKNEFLTGQQKLPLGGGMLGASYYNLFGYLFGKWGTYIFSTILFFLGLFMLCQIKIEDVIRAISRGGRELVTGVQNFVRQVSDLTRQAKENQQSLDKIESFESDYYDETFQVEDDSPWAKPPSWLDRLKAKLGFSNNHYYPDYYDQAPDLEDIYESDYQPIFVPERPEVFDEFQRGDRLASTAARMRKGSIDEVVLDLDYFDQLTEEDDDNPILPIQSYQDAATDAESTKSSNQALESLEVIAKNDQSEASASLSDRPQPQAEHWQDQAHDRKNLTEDELERQLQEAESKLDNKAESAQETTEVYRLPGKDLLSKLKPVDQTEEYEKIEQNIAKLEQTFQSFGVDARVVKANLGPAVTKYEIEPAIGVKVSKIVSLTDDIALALAARDIRMEAPIPGKSLIGIEVPNSKISPVSFSEIVDAALQSDKLLEVPLGRDVEGAISTADLSKMPHLLIAGSTGSGKSVGMNVIICSLLMKAYPEEVKFLMIDPKKVELTMYNEIPHLLAPVVTNPRKAAKALNQVVEEMERRYEKFAEMNVRNQESYNEQVEILNQEEGTGYEKMPKIVVFIDELADLMLVAGNEVENSIIRLAQMARAAGIHMIIATQRPSVDVITGIIKANIPSRLAFAVTSGTDSRTILDANGAEKLLGKGDMLFQPISMNKPIRVQGAYISDSEVERITDFIKAQRPSDYVEEMMITDEDLTSLEASEDEYFEEAVDLIKDQETVSISQLQRKFRIGYNRAARLIDDLEALGYIGPADGSKPRQVYLNE